MRGLILFAHGARDPAWAAPFEQIAARVRALLPEAHVDLAFLEFMQPDLATSAARLVEAGCESVEVLPLFLGSGGHVRRDLPAQVEALRQRWPAVGWQIRPAVGESAVLIEAMATIAAALPEAP